MGTRTSKERQPCPLFMRPEMEQHKRAVLRHMRADGHTPAFEWRAAVGGSSFCADGYAKRCLSCGAQAMLYVPGAYVDEEGVPQVRDWSKVHTFRIGPCPSRDQVGAG